MTEQIRPGLMSRRQLIEELDATQAPGSWYERPFVDWSRAELENEVRLRRSEDAVSVQDGAIAEGARTQRAPSGEAPSPDRRPASELKADPAPPVPLPFRKRNTAAHVQCLDDECGWAEHGISKTVAEHAAENHFAERQHDVRANWYGELTLSRSAPTINGEVASEPTE